MRWIPLALCATWREVAWVALDVLGVLACIGGIDCIALGLRDLRRAEREYDRRVALLTGATGIGLLLIGGLLFWASWALSVKN